MLRWPLVLLFLSLAQVQAGWIQASDYQELISETREARLQLDQVLHSYEGHPTAQGPDVQTALIGLIERQLDAIELKLEQGPLTQQQVEAIDLQLEDIRLLMAMI